MMLTYTSVLWTDSAIVLVYDKDGDLLGVMGFADLQSAQCAVPRINEYAEVRCVVMYLRVGDAQRGRMAA